MSARVAPSFLCYSVGILLGTRILFRITMLDQRYNLRLSETDKELWQQFADSEFNGKLGHLIRAAVTNYVTGEITAREQIDIILELQTMNSKLDGIMEMAHNSYNQFIKDSQMTADLQKVIDEKATSADLIKDESGDIIPLADFETDPDADIPDDYNPDEIMKEREQNMNEELNDHGSSRFDF